MSQELEGAFHWWYNSLTGQPEPVHKLDEITRIVLGPKGKWIYYKNGTAEFRPVDGIPIFYINRPYEEPNLTAEDCAFLWDCGIQADKDITDPLPRPVSTRIL